MSRRCWRISASQQGAHRAGDGGDSAFRRLLLYAGNNPQLSGALSPVRIRLIDSSVGNVIEAVSSGQADFGLCFAKNLPASIEFTPLADDRYVAACRHDHPLARKTHLSWQAYFEQDYIGLGSGLRQPDAA